MTEKVRVHVTGEHKGAGGEKDTFTTKTNGTYRFMNGKHYMKYEEQVEGFTEKNQNLLVFDEQGAVLTKKGIQSTQMRFTRGKREETYYNTGFGCLKIGVITSGYRIFEHDGKLELFIDYSLIASGERVSDARLHVSIRPLEEEA